MHGLSPGLSAVFHYSLFSGFFVVIVCCLGSYSFVVVIVQVRQCMIPDCFPLVQSGLCISMVVYR